MGGFVKKVFKAVFGYCDFKFSHVLKLQANCDFQKIITQARNNIFDWVSDDDEIIRRLNQ